VIEAHELNQTDMQTTARRFSQELESADTGLFFYKGAWGTIFRNTRSYRGLNREAAPPGSRHAGKPQSAPTRAERDPACIHRGRVSCGAPWNLTMRSPAAKLSPLTSVVL
jgi:hypothetical protein